MEMNISPFTFTFTSTSTSSQLKLPVPPPPILTLTPPKISQNYQYYKQKRHIALLNGQPQYSGSKQQIQKKYKHLYQKNQSQESTKITNIKQLQNKKINITLYGLCNRCNRWLLKSQMNIHMSCHAAIVLDNLLLGDRFCSESKKQLFQRNNVTHIVNAARQLKNYFQDRQIIQNNLVNKKITYLNLTLEDNMTQDLMPQILRAVDWIKNIFEQQLSEKNNQSQKFKKNKVFVHCAMGKSRSASVIIVYLMKHHKMTLDESIQFIRKVRPLIKPNPNYMKQLRQYQQTLLKQQQLKKERNSQNKQMNE